MIKCSTCNNEIVPDKDKVVQIRLGYIEEGYVSGSHFIPNEDLDYLHLDCFNKTPKPTTS